LLVLGGNGWPASGGYGFYNTPDAGYTAGPDWPDYYSALSYAAAPSPAPVAAGEPKGVGSPDPECSSDETSQLPVYRGPTSRSETSDEHPPLVALKNRWAYTVIKYWVSGKTFHFITTQGDHIQVPSALVERIYPTPNQSHRTDPKPPPAH
jgi:hypothetical protein